MSHDRIEELVIAHAVDGTLDVDDARELIPHLAACSECRTLLEDLSGAAAELAFLGDPVAPPARLEQRIIGAVRRIESPERSGVGGRVRRRFAALAVAATMAFASTSVVLYNSLEEERGERQRIAAAMAIISDPAASLAQLEAPEGQASGIVAIAADGSGVLVVEGLAPAPAGKIHELWLIEGGQPRPVDVFPITGERTIVPISVEDRTFDAAAITIERAPSGSAVPTGNMLLTGQIA